MTGMFLNILREDLSKFFKDLAGPFRTLQVRVISVIHSLINVTLNSPFRNGKVSTYELHSL